MKFMVLYITIIIALAIWEFLLGAENKKYKKK
jgi:hypothetical protein